MMILPTSVFTIIAYPYKYYVHWFIVNLYFSCNILRHVRRYASTSPDQTAHYTGPVASRLCFPPAAWVRLQETTATHVTSKLLRCIQNPPGAIETHQVHSKLVSSIRHLSIASKLVMCIWYTLNEFEACQVHSKLDCCNFFYFTTLIINISCLCLLRDL